MVILRQSAVLTVLVLLCVGSAEALSSADTGAEDLLPGQRTKPAAITLNVLRSGESVAPFLSLLEIGEELRKDECAGAYEKFKTNIQSMEKLKAQSVKKAAEEVKKSAQAVADLKECNDGHKEVLVKADWKQSKIQAKVKELVQQKVGKTEKKLKESNKTTEKKLEKKVVKAEKKEAKAAAKASDAKKTEKVKVQAAKDKEKTTVETVKAKAKSKEKKDVEKDVKGKLLKVKVEEKKKVEKKEEKKIAEVKKDAKKEVKEAIKDQQETVKKVEKASDDKLKAAEKVTPPDVEIKVIQEEAKAKADEKEVKEAKAALVKETDTAKDKEQKMEEKETELKDSNKSAEAKVGDMARETKVQEMKIVENKINEKADTVKIADQAAQLSAEKEEKPILVDKAKADASRVSLLESQLNDAKIAISKGTAEQSTLRAQMAATAGELTSKIEMLQKESQQKDESIKTLQASDGQLRLDKKAFEAKAMSGKIKYRSASADTYKLEQEVAASKQDLSNLKVAHDKLKDRLSDSNAKRELAQSRLSDSNNKHLVCSESMRRLTQSSEDTIGELRRRVDTLNSSVDLEKEKLRAVEASREEGKKTEKIAKQAAETATTKANLVAGAAAPATR